jgi:lipoyl(octanoyl) transferase
VEWLGRVPYAEALEVQRRAVDARRSTSCGDRLLLLEHPPVVTMGRGTRQENLLVGREELRRRGVEVHEVSRGGDVTYHAPGQLVGYLVMDLRARGEADLHVFLRNLESALIDALAALELAGKRVEGRTGVFIDDSATVAAPERKIASIGVGVRHWITFHGFALNVTTDLAGFDAIIPCGLEDVEMTSVAAELGRGLLGLDARVRSHVGAAFRKQFA